MLLKKLTIILSLTLFAISGLCAQNLGTSRFSGSVNSSGVDNFIIANNGTQRTYQTGTIPVNGLALQNSDMIQTGPGNYVEVQLDPSGAIIKLAENTSAIFSDLGSSSRPALINLLYGRMRVVNQGISGTVSVQAGNALVDFSRGDIAFDFAVIPGSANRNPQFQVSILSGSAQVVPSVGSPGAAKMPLYEHETVLLDVTNRLAILTRQPLNQEIAAYWSRNAFRQAGMPTQSTQIAQSAAPQVVRGSQSTLPTLGASYPATTNYAPIIPISVDSLVNDNGTEQGTSASNDPNQYMMAPTAARPLAAGKSVALSGARATIPPKNSGVLMGAILTAVGVLGQSVAHYNMFALDSDTVDKVYMVSYAPLGIGIVALVASYLYSYR
jgi:hypothetical protein